MKFMVCAYGEPDEIAYIPRVQELDAGIELQSYALKGASSLALWNERFQKHLAFRRHFDGPLAVHGPFLGILYHYIDHLLQEAVRTRMNMTFDMVRALHAQRLVLHSSFNLEVGKFRFTKTWLAETVAFWKEEIQRYADINTQVVLENVLEPDASIGIAIHDEVDHPNLKLCLDLGHVNVWATAPHVDWIQKMGSRLAHVHLHDNNGEEDQHGCVGSGTIDFAAIGQALRTYSPDTTVSLEIVADKETVLHDLRTITSMFTR